MCNQKETVPFEVQLIVPSLSLYLSTKAEVINAILESYYENEQEIKSSLLPSGELGTKKIISLEMQQ